MSDKTSDKNKRYRITLTERQLALVGNAVELMMRTGRGQMFNLADWIVLSGHDIPSSGGVFDIYIAQRDVIKGVIQGIVKEMQMVPHGKGTSNPVLELTTLYEAIGHQQWLDNGDREGGRRMRPIDADYLKTKVHKVYGYPGKILEADLDDAPTLDIKPAIHAHWNVIDHGEEIVNAYPHYWATLKCSNCGMERDVKDYYSPSFCESCGAKMDEVTLP